jgi:hypothetical protein
VRTAGMTRWGSARAVSGPRQQAARRPEAGPRMQVLQAEEARAPSEGPQMLPSMPGAESHRFSAASRSRSRGLLRVSMNRRVSAGRRRNLGLHPQEGGRSTRSQGLPAHPSSSRQSPGRHGRHHLSTVR